MPLDPEKIKQLLAKKNAPRRSGGGGRKKADTSVRDYPTWFAVGSHLYPNEDGSTRKCENPNCQDPRQHGILLIDVDGTYMCRYCFLGGWLTKNPAQVVVGEQSDEA
jgi:hypothetical protein